MTYDLRGKRVLVTGASGGIGAALAEGFAQRGAVVGICARRADLLAEVLERIGRHSPDSRAWPVDLAELDGLDAFAETAVEQLGGLDVLVNNAGIPKRRWAWDLRADEISDVLRVNVESPIRLTTALLDRLIRSSGRVVFVGSVAARLAPPAESVYAASKAAVTAFAECLAVDLRVAGHAVGVHVVQPGVIDTELFHLPDNDATIADLEPLPVADLVGPVLDLVESGERFELFVPEWLGDVPAVKVADLDGFLQGSAEYTQSRLEALGRVIAPRSAPTSTRTGPRAR